VGIELSVTVWERTYRETLTPDFFAEIKRVTCDPFDEIAVTINNVTDTADAQARAEALRADGVVSRVDFVEPVLPAALRMAGLRQRHLDPLPHYTDHFLAKIYNARCDYLAHWDTDARQDRQADWVRTAVQLLDLEQRVLVVNPAWPHRASIDALTLFSDDQFDYTLGFSDQVFVARRRDLAAPIYRAIAPATWWQPTSHLTAIFERRVSAYMRTSGRLRAVYRGVSQSHDAPMAQHVPGTLGARLRRRAQHEVFVRLNAPERAFRPRWVDVPQGRSVPEKFRALRS
jgi:hypothetical protein